MNRRQFFAESGFQVVRWLPWMALFGFQFHRYAAGNVGGWVGWVTFCGKTIGFVPK